MAVLRHFRDRYLLTHSAGRAFVAFYYENSPPVAEVIRQNDALRATTRWALTPVVFMIEYPVGAGSLLLLALALLFFCAARWRSQGSCG